LLTPLILKAIFLSVGEILLFGVTALEKSFYLAIIVIRGSFIMLAVRVMG
jgi:hypothetical protein